MEDAALAEEVITEVAEEGEEIIEVVPVVAEAVEQEIRHKNDPRRKIS